MARTSRTAGKASPLTGGKPTKGSPKAAGSENAIAREMANRVQDEFEAGYREDFTGVIPYETSSQGISADTVFFHLMIYRSIEKNFEHIPDKPELSEGTKKAAREHGALVSKLSRPVKLIDILTTFYAVKEKYCPMTKAGLRPLGPVCEF